VAYFDVQSRLLLQELNIREGVKTWVCGVAGRKRVSERNSFYVNQEFIRPLWYQKVHFRGNKRACSWMLGQISTTCVQLRYKCSHNNFLSLQFVFGTILYSLRNLLSTNHQRSFCSRSVLILEDRRCLLQEILNCGLRSWSLALRYTAYVHCVLA